MDLNFVGKTVFITGAATGIGRETALEFARSGASVCIADMNEKEGRQTQRLVEELGGKAIFVHCNVGEEESVASAIAETVKHFGGLHAAFNNAGISGGQGFTADMKSEDWAKVIQINLSGVFYCMKYQIPEILKSGGGAIVNCSSILGTVGFAGASAYVASKHGVIGLTQTAALEYAQQGIRVNSVGPGFVLTPMLENAGITTDQAMRGYIESLHPVGRLGKPEEISSLVVYLCSERSSFITGQHIHADGGYTTR